MSCTLPSPRAIGRALAVLQALPSAALADLAERLIDRLDALDGDPDSEPDGDTEADDDDEAPPDREGPWWAPTEGPDGCGVLRLAGAS